MHASGPNAARLLNRHPITQPSTHRRDALNRLARPPSGRSPFRRPREPGESQVKHFVAKATTAIFGLSLLLGASTASAQISKANPVSLVGSDTLNGVTDAVLVILKDRGSVSADGNGGIDLYDGIGSSAGERQMEGVPNATEPACGWTGAGDNPGCQEISTMSRPMDDSICNDDDNGLDNAAENAEGIAVCRDGIVIVTGNEGHKQYGVDQASCDNFPSNTNNDSGGTVPSFPNRGTGVLRDSGTVNGYQIGGGSLAAGEEWKDVVRLVYTGCDNTMFDANGNSTCTTVDRAVRCNSAVRQALVSQWSNLFEGIDCNGASANACNELRRAYRRDDSSGTTQVFLEILEVEVSLDERISMVFRPTPFSNEEVTPIPDDFAFCDGGESEGFFLSATGDPPGDPIRTYCSPEEDVCGAAIVQNIAWPGVNGTVPVGSSGLVQAMRTPPATGAYPLYQCDPGAFQRVPYIESALPVCPAPPPANAGDIDWRIPTPNGCHMPFYEDDNGVKHFDCLNAADSKFISMPAHDGRIYNDIWVEDTENGPEVQYVDANYPESATWRANMAELTMTVGVFPPPLNPGHAFAQSEVRCQQPDATTLASCLAATVPCSFAFAGRSAATNQPYDDDQEPVLLGGAPPSNPEIAGNDYGFARFLYMNALNGFENVFDDCMAVRGLDPNTDVGQYCRDEVVLAQTFNDPNEYLPPSAGNPDGGAVWATCIDSGFIPLEYDPANPTSTGPICEGMEDYAGCGEPTDIGGCGLDRQCSRGFCAAPNPPAAP